LKECGVFGVSGHEYLSHATENKREWEARGHYIVQEMLKAAHHNEVGRKILSISFHNDEKAVASAERDILKRRSIFK
jgi:hypothetical protein